MRNIILVKNLQDEKSVKLINNALADTRVVYEISLEKKCIIVDGNADMVAITKKILHDLGFVTL